MSALLDLAVRCEQATGPDPVLDGMIGAVIRFGYEAIGPEHELEADAEDGSISVYVGKRKVKRFHAPKFTASLDAAMTLVPKGYIHGTHWMGPDHGCTAFSGTFVGKGASHALALCAAALRTRAASEQQV